MADSKEISSSTLQESLERLARKPGVQAALALERTTGAIIKTTGNFSAFRSTTSANTSTDPTSPTASFSASNTNNSLEDGSNAKTETSGADELAALVWSFVNAAGGLVTGLDNEDEIKLLRLRTKKHELVIVPDAKYLLTVVHETPPA